MKKLIVLSLLAISGLASAETAYFTGTVSTSCAFAQGTTGTLVSASNGSTYYVTSERGSGSRASVGITYSGAPTFTIEAPTTFTSDPGNVPSSSFSTGVSFDNGANSINANTVNADNFSNGTKNFSLTDTVTQDTAYVKFEASSSSAFPTGNYSANVTFTCQ